MIGHYLLTAVRAAKRQHFIYGLNALNLTIGFTTIFLITLFMHYELSYDKQWSDGEQVYRVELRNDQQQTVNAFFNAQLASELNKIAHVKNVYKLAPMKDWFWFDDQLQIEGQKYKLNNVVAASRNISQIFTVKVIQGDLNTALSSPNYIALSQKQALRLFGKTDVVGKKLDRAASTLTVKAVFEDLPEQTHLYFDAIVPLDAQYLRYVKTYHEDAYIYLKIDDARSVTSVETAISALVNAQRENSLVRLSAQLKALTRIHLEGTSQGELKVGGSLRSIFICIAVSMLLFAVVGINFFNMALASLHKRGREIGVRKAMGVTSLQLLMQFAIEFALLISVTILVSLGLCEQLLPWFSEWVGRAINMKDSGIVLITLSVGLITLGALFGAISGVRILQKPTSSLLSGALESGTHAAKGKYLLIGFQIACAISMIIAAMTINKQLQFIHGLSFGYQTAQRIYIPQIERAALQKDSALMNRLNALSSVEKATFVDNDLTKEVPIKMSLSWMDKGVTQSDIRFSGVGYEGAEVLGLELIAGRDFLPQYQSDWYHRTADNTYQASTIVTKSLANKMGFNEPKDALGFTFTNQDGNRHHVFKIVGVVDDVKVGNLRETPEPVFFVCGLSWMGKLAIQIKLALTADINSINSIEQLVAQHFQIEVIPSQRLSENYLNTYQHDAFIGQVIYLFSALAIALCCLGVFSLAAYGVRARQKEISVRKVLGATRFQLVALITHVYIKLTLLSAAIAIPITYFVVADWLAAFNERITQTGWLYTIAVVFVGFITWVTVASLAFKAASSRPSLILRYE